MIFRECFKHHFIKNKKLFAVRLFYFINDHIFTRAHLALTAKGKIFFFKTNFTYIQKWLICILKMFI